MGEARFHPRLLCVEQTALGPLLAATVLDGLAYRCFLSGADDSAIVNHYGRELSWHRQVGGGVLAVTHTTAGATDGETDIFAGRRVVFGFRAAESATAAIDWIRYHHRFGVTAALIFDRSPPEESAVFQAALKVELQGFSKEFCVMVVGADQPMGRVGDVDIRSAGAAPAAPSHIRAASSDGEGWFGSFRETILLEALRRRYLAKAASVAFLDVSDLMLASDGEASAFERAEAMPGETILMEGTEYYMWRRRKARDRHLDHVYARRDERRKSTRWCVSPTALRDPSVWRNIRIGGATGEYGSTGFLRAMGLRHPKAPIAQLVDKAALKDDANVRGLFEKVFGDKALSAPEIVQPDFDGTGVTVVTAMKNEGPYILDWIAHHRVVGVDRFLVYTNDCDDGTDELLDALASEGVLERRENPYRQTGHVPQYAAFRAAESETAVRDSAWCVTLDVDEYINVHVGEGRLSDLFEAADGANVISMPWRLFGNADVESFRDAPVVHQFVQCAPEYCARPHQAWGFKTLFRNDGLFRRLGVHRPKGLVDHDRIHWVGGDGRPFPPREWRNGWRMSSETWGYDLVTLNHYAVRSAESYLVKRDRGRVNHVDRGQGVAYWFRMNHNAEVDRSIRRYDNRVATERAKLAALPGVQGEHDRSVDWHRERIDKLMQATEFHDLYQEVTGERLRKLSRMLRHFGGNVFLSGPDVIPDDVAARPTGEDWHFTIEKPVRAD